MGPGQNNISNMITTHVLIKLKNYNTENNLECACSQKYDFEKFKVDSHPPPHDAITVVSKNGMPRDHMIDLSSIASVH